MRAYQFTDSGQGILIEMANEKCAALTSTKNMAEAKIEEKTEASRTISQTLFDSNTIEICSLKMEFM